MSARLRTSPGKKVTETAAGKCISAYVIFNKKGFMVGKVLAHYANSGGVTVNVWDFGHNYETDTKYYEGHAGGYGYDKFTAALSGATIDGHLLTNHCGVSLQPPAKRNYFLRSFKAPKGYSLCNGMYVDKSGREVSRLAEYEYKEDGTSDFKRWFYVVGRHVSNWDYNQAPDTYETLEDEDVSYVQTSCYKRPGLEYLRELGYQVVQAI